MPKPVAVLLAALAALFAAVPASAAQRPDPRIINGADTPQGHYAWTVALVEPGSNRAFCGGTLIEDNVVLTAAHCTIGSRPDEIDVIAGRANLDAVGGVREDVASMSLHRDAEGDSDDLVPRRDASLLTLADPLPLNQDVQVMPLGAITDADALAADAPLDVSGWGLTDPGGTATVALMQHATVEKVADPDCASIFESLFGHLVFSPVDQICAIDDADENPATPGDVIDTCNGDSGGPLVAPVAVTPDPADAGDWELIGVTSWGLACAFTLEEANPADNTIVPGVYARIADAQLHGYASAGVDGTDENPPQPAWDPTGGDPQIAATTGGSIFCVGNALDWDFTQPDQMEQLIRRQVAPGSYETVSFTGFYALDEGDDGDEFICEVHGRASGVGGYGRAQSDAVSVADAPVVEPTLVEVPVPVPVPVPGDTVFVPVPQPRVDDETDPRVSSVKRSCTRRRVCTFTIRATDTGTGVKTIAATLNTVRTRSCRRNGRRTLCASWRPTTLRARKVTGTASTFRLVTKRLTRGTHVLHARAIDAAGNIQATPRAVTFRLR